MEDYNFQQNDSVDYSNPAVEQQSFAQMGLPESTGEERHRSEQQSNAEVTKHRVNRQRVHIDEMLLGVSREEMPRVSLKQVDMVRRQYLSHIREAMVTIRPDGIQFNNSCIVKMPDVVYIQLFIDRGKRHLIIKGCDEYDKDGQRWCSEKNDRRQSRKITGRPFCEKVYKMMAWSKGYYYKICGVPALQEDDEDELLFVFELEDFERYALTAKSRKAAGVEDEDLSEAELLKLAEEEKAKKTSKKKGKFPEAWGTESFGPSAEVHSNRIVIPKLSELEILSENENSNT